VSSRDGTKVIRKKVCGEPLACRLFCLTL
jgi:hypothetical protein